ncbi:MAG: SCO family protein, partial [Rhodospirillales bacterium]|nr:SCO family protein [Rhodospirillales bacterium]
IKNSSGEVVKVVNQGTPVIGGPFTLTDHNGNRVSDTDFRGKFMLIFFGYTYCPDVCPTSLSTISDALESLGERANNIQPIFISVDPLRDTPAHLKEYVGYFDPRIIGLTGTEDEVAAVAKAYRAYYAKVREEGADPNDYLIDHTAIVYLVDPKGRFTQHFPHGYAVDKMAARLAKHLEEEGL